MTPWLSVVGIGEDGLDGIGTDARGCIDAAEILLGGERHLALVPERGGQERLTWGDDINAVLDRLEGDLRGRAVCVLASGDPMMYGIGSNLTKRFDTSELAIIPAVSAFSLAAARMGWPLSDPMLACLSVHGRPIERLHAHVAPRARLVILSRDGTSPAAVAALLTKSGFGPSAMVVFEHMGGDRENCLTATAARWPAPEVAKLNTIAVECRALPAARLWPRTPGLPENAFEHDGMITKREVRAATIAALAPLLGQILWDVGAGSGAVAIEWLRAEASTRAVAIERLAERAQVVGRNAAKLGVPELCVVIGSAPAVFSGIEGSPDAIFVGGGVSAAGLLDACWQGLSAPGRLVANAVTVEAQQALMAFRQQCGGELTRITVSRSQPVGGLSALRPMMDVLQLLALKS